MDRKFTFAKTTRQMLDEAKKLSPEATRQLLARLAEARDEIVACIASVPAGGYKAAQLLRARAEMERVMAEFARDAGLDLNQGQAKAYEVAAEAADRAMRAAGLQSMLGSLSRTQLAVNHVYGLKSLAGVASETTAKIDKLLDSAFLGGKPLQVIQNEIGSLLAGDGKIPSYFSAAGKLAALITHNEIHRRQNMAAQARLESFAQRDAERGDKLRMGKEWRHSVAPDMSPRPGHVKLNGTVIPVKEKFVDEETGDELLFPGDPDADESATTGCKCYLLPAML